MTYRYAWITSVRMPFRSMKNELAIYFSVLVVSARYRNTLVLCGFSLVPIRHFADLVEFFILNFSFFGKTFLLNHLAYIFAVKFRLVWLGPLWKSLEVILLFLFIKIGNFFKFEICRIRRSGKFELKIRWVHVY